MLRSFPWSRGYQSARLKVHAGVRKNNRRLVIVVDQIVDTYSSCSCCSGSETQLMEPIKAL